MKKIVALALIATMAFSLCACGGEKKEEAKAEETTAAETTAVETTAEEMTIAETEEESEENNPPSWKIEKLIDDFGDETSDAAIVISPIEGSFSNSATRNSPLLVTITYFPKYVISPDFIVDYSQMMYSEHAIDAYVFSLYEYGNDPVTFYSSDEVILKMKIEGEVYQESLTEFDNNIAFTVPAAGLKSDDKLRKALRNGESVKCIIQSDNSEYSFEISGKGYLDALGALEDMYGWGSYYKKNK